MPKGTYNRKPFTSKHKKNIKECHNAGRFIKGHVMSKRICLKISRTAKARGVGKWMLGKKHKKETKEKMSQQRRGDNHYNWKGGKRKLPNGYIFVYMPQHPYAGNHHLVREHRLIVEKQIGRYLLPTEQVHHLGETDDNRPEMLMAFINNSAHQRFEHGRKVKPEEIIFDGRNIEDGEIKE